jgi:hypothetical protein
MFGSIESAVDSRAAGGVHGSSWLEDPAQGGIAVGLEPLGEAGAAREQVEPVDPARVDAQFRRHTSLDEALGVLDVLVDEQVDVADRDVGGRETRKVTRPRRCRVGETASVSTASPT